MDIDNSDVDSVKCVLNGIPRAVLAARGIVKMLRNRDTVYPGKNTHACCGRLMLDANGNYNFALAVYQCLAMCGTKVQDEWLVCSARAFIYLRAVPAFNCIEPAEAHELMFVGTLGKTVTVYLDVLADGIFAPQTDFYAGVGEHSYVTGIINNGCFIPTSHSPPREIFTP